MTSCSQPSDRSWVISCPYAILLINGWLPFGHHRQAASPLLGCLHETTLSEPIERFKPKDAATQAVALARVIGKEG